jgi:hypothetical protein
MIASIVAIGVSCFALLRLAHFDPKRRRALGLPEETGRRGRGLLALLLVPGGGLLLLGDAAGLMIWFGALTLLGWGIAAGDPRRLGRGWAWARGIPSRIGLDGAARVRALEVRVAALEAELEKTRGLAPSPTGAAGPGPRVLD